MEETKPIQTLPYSNYTRLPETMPIIQTLSRGFKVKGAEIQHSPNIRERQEVKCDTLYPYENRYCEQETVFRIESNKQQYNYQGGK